MNHSYARREELPLRREGEEMTAMMRKSKECACTRVYDVFGCGMVNVLLNGSNDIMNEVFGVGGQFLIFHCTLLRTLVRRFCKYTDGNLPHNNIIPNQGIAQWRRPVRVIIYNVK